MRDKKAASGRPSSKRKKASSRATAVTGSATALSGRRARRRAVGHAAVEAGAGGHFQKTRAQAIQAHVSARGRRRQAKRDSR